MKVAELLMPASKEATAVSYRLRAIALGILATGAMAVSADIVIGATPEAAALSSERRDIGRLTVSASSTPSERRKQTQTKEPKTKWVPATGGQQRKLGVAVSEKYINKPGYVDLVEENFDVIVPENELKMTEVLPPFGWGLNFTGLDRILDTWNKPVRGHTLIFGGKDDAIRINRLGETCRQNFLGSKRGASNEMIRIDQQYITEVMRRNPDRFTSWDVINEPLTYGGKIKKTARTYCQGEGYIDRALIIAHNADKKAMLYINEIGAELPGDKQDGLIKLIEDLKARGVPIHGVGLQTHVDLSFLESIEDFRETLRRFAALGVAIQITELDVALPENPTLEDLKKQTKVYKAITKACIEQAVCLGITVWGVRDDVSWKTRNNPTLFHADNVPKEAYKFMRKYIR